MKDYPVPEELKRIVNIMNEGPQGVQRLLKKIEELKEERDRYATACIEHSELADEAVHKADRFQKALEKIIATGLPYKRGSNRFKDIARDALDVED